jgi:hypothetical protein
MIDAETDVFPRAGGDGRDDGAYGGLHGVVNGTGIVDEDASKFLAELHLSRGELASGSTGLCILLFLSIYRGGIGVRRMLRFLGRHMLKSGKGFRDVIRHGEVNGSVGVIPIQMDTAEDFAITIDCYIIVFLEALDEVVGVGLANDFDAKVINDKIESGGTGNVMKKAGSVTSGDISVVSKMFDEFYVRKSPGLRKAIHAGAYFGKELLVFDEGAEVVLFHDVLRDGPFGDVEILVLAGMRKGGEKVKI